MRIFLASVLILGLAHPAVAQDTNPDEEIVVVGIRNGDRVVDVDFEKVWRNCAECKRALAKLKVLAQTYHDESELAALMAGGSHASDQTAVPSSIGTWQRSSANAGPTTVAGLAAARRAETSRVVYEHLYKKHVAPERTKMMNYMQSFLDQLTPHIVKAAEQERVERGARATLIGKGRTKVKAKRLVRTDVTNAVIKRLDATAFTIMLPDPPPNQSAARK